MVVKHPGNKLIALRGNPEFHAKINRLAKATGTDKSAVIRSCVEIFDEPTLAQLINAHRAARPVDTVRTPQ